MKSPICSIDGDAPIVADASAIINLNASGCALEIIKALPNRLVVMNIVRSELDRGQIKGRRDAEFLNDLVSAGLVETVKLSDRAEEHFERLVVGPAAMTLDDGEAATIAHAIERKGIAVIDERKANRICVELFPTLRVACTTDIFAHPHVIGAMGRPKLTQGVIYALQLARMRVLPHHIEWVIDLIGPEQAALCASLPRSVRRRDGKVTSNAA